LPGAERLPPAVPLVILAIGAEAREPIFTELLRYRFARRQPLANLPPQSGPTVGLMDLLKFGAQQQLLRVRKFTLVDQQLDFALGDPLVLERIDGGQPFFPLRNRRRAVG